MRIFKCDFCGSDIGYRYYDESFDIQVITKNNLRYSFEVCKKCQKDFEYQVSLLVKNLQKNLKENPIS